MDSLNMPGPLCLVENTDDRGLVVNTETVDIISRISQQIVVVSVVGPYRTGKSFLMNRLMGRNNGFALGSTIQSKTKGIWIWCRPHPYKRDHCLILLDTEGLGDVEKGDVANDNWIFALAIMLSSTLVYNSMASLQNDAIDKLHFVAELTDLIKVRSSTRDEDGKDFFKFFPSFVWTVRDFTLDLEIDGQEVNADEYLQNALKLKKGSSRRIIEYNLPRECIINYFKERKCFTFDRPVQDLNLFREIESLPDTQLDPAFLIQVNRFCEYIFCRSFTKNFRGRVLNGSSLCSILGMFVETIKDGRVPCLENAYETMTTIENGKAVEEAYEIYRNIYDLVTFPTETAEQLSQIHQACDKQAVTSFLRRSFDDQDNRHQSVLKTKIKEEYGNINEKNCQASEEKCKQLLQRLSAEIEGKTGSGHFTRSGGYQEYEMEKNKVVQLYNNQQGKGVRAQAILQEFLNSKEAEGKYILGGDQAMSQKEKEIAAQRQVAELNDQKAKAAEEEAKKLKQLLKDQKESNKQHLEQLEQKMNEEHAQALDEQKRIMEQKFKDQQEMMQQGFERQAREHAEEVSDLKTKVEELENRNSIIGLLDKASKVLTPILLPIVTARFGVPRASGATGGALGDGENP